MKDALDIEWTVDATARRRDTYYAASQRKFVPFREPLVFRKGSMQYLWDAEGKKYTDLLGMNVCISVGHSHPTVVNAAIAQAQDLTHCTTMFYHPVPAHFAAVSVNGAAMDAFGVHPDHRFAMWDWVGGRYSIWSSIGVSLAIAIGPERFLEFLGGAQSMDRHFRTAPWSQNLPVLAAMLGAWNVNGLGLPTHAVLPYDQRLARLPAYLQQLEMESNGKSVALDGRPAPLATCPVIWGEPGSNAQHSFFQLLHQGNLRAACDLLLPARSSCGREDLQRLAIGNCLAQAEAFAFGQGAEQVRAELARQGLAPERIAELLPHKIHAGGRPCTLMLFERLDPATLGRLIALYEHKVFVQGVVWGVNSYDQWGVELGKKLCEGILPLVDEPAKAEGRSSALRGALTRLAAWRG